MIPADQALRELETQNKELADKYAKPGSVQHFAIRLGFAPHDEKNAELILVRCLQEADIL